VGSIQARGIELIPTVTMEKGHSVEGSFSREFSPIYIVRSYYRLKSEVVGDVIEKYAFWKKNNSLLEDFQKFRSKRIHHLELRKWT